MPKQTGGSPALSSGHTEDSEVARTLLQHVHNYQAGRAQKQAQKQVAVIARAKEAVERYKDEVAKIQEDEEDKIRARSKAFEEEDARLTVELLEAELELLRLLRSRSSDAQLGIAAVRLQCEEVNQAVGTARTALQGIDRNEQDVVKKRFEAVWPCAENGAAKQQQAQQGAKEQKEQGTSAAGAQDAEMAEA
ncbi:uncharacterized protein JCM10292_000646 [Rhodotorula paludigena]|uniref:uncharacterized protein n=1 Tax=Rhodotorula paludigena TaxID=86838 RepID=UPI003176C559